MFLSPPRLAARALVGSILRLAAAPAHALTTLSDEADELWETFLDDSTSLDVPRLAA
jgi:hypothetical protein